MEWQRCFIHIHNPCTNSTGVYCSNQQEQIEPYGAFFGMDYQEEMTLRHFNSSKSFSVRVGGNNKRFII